MPLEGHRVPEGRLDESIALALRAVRHPETGLAALLAVQSPSLQARLVAVYLAPGGPGPAELLASGGPEVTRAGAPGPANPLVTDLVRRLVVHTVPVSEPTPSDVPPPWREFPFLGRIGTPLPRGAACVLVVGGDRPADDAALREASGPVALLAATLIAGRECERLRQELHELRQSRSLLAAGLQHDLRTPLTSIMGSAATLRDRAELLNADEHEEMLGIILSQASRMNEMVSQALSLEALDSDAPPRAIRTDLLDLAKKVASVARAAREGEILIEVPSAEVCTDPSRVERALLNLLDNALKYSPPESPVYLIGESVDDEFNFTVADAGAGVTPSLVPTLFSAYATDPNRPGGIGLGLHSVANLAAELGGRLWYARREGWTRFTLTIPDLKTKERARAEVGEVER